MTLQTTPVTIQEPDPLWYSTPTSNSPKHITCVVTITVHPSNARTTDVHPSTVFTTVVHPRTVIFQNDCVRPDYDRISYLSAECATVYHTGQQGFKYGMVAQLGVKFTH